MNLTQEEWASKLQNDTDATILDVRTDEEWEEGFIPGAIHVDIYQGQGFIDQINELDKNKSYYVYCKAGGRSQQACHIMNELGFDKTFNLTGGISQWEGDVETPE
ncbi:MAG: rhodanese-like domain-containing protein [Flavobacterium sp.]|nr:rhodanese-like domain-containing protein [Flavobacterium sp.]